MGCGCNKQAAVGAANAHSLMSALTFSSGEVLPPGDYARGYVLATFLPEQGTPRPASGRIYPTMRAGQEWWVHPDDVAANPRWWRLVGEPEHA